MSNAKVIRLLLLGILLLTGLHLFLDFNGGGHELVKRATLVDVAAQNADRIVITRAGEAPTELKRTSDWSIIAPYAARAEARPIRRLVDALTLTRIAGDRIYSEAELLKVARTKADYGLETPSVTVTIGREGEERTVRFGIFTPTRDGVFASLGPDDPNVYVVETNVFVAVNLPSEGFRLRSFCPVETETVDAFELKRGSGSFMRFARRAGGWSILIGREGDSAEPASAVKVRRLLADLGRARAESFIWPVGATNEPQAVTAPLLAGYGLDPDSAVTVTLHGLGPAPQQVSFGRAATDGKVYALVQNAGAIVTVDGALGDFVRTTDFADTRIFPFERETVSRVAIADDGVNYLLAKNGDGTWLLDAPVAAPADAARVDALVARLLSLKSADRDEKGVSVSLQTNAPSESVSRAALLDSFSLADLRSREILNVVPGDVRRLTVTRGAEKPVAVVYDSDLRKWKVESSDKTGTVLQSAVDGLLRTLAPLKAEKVVNLKVSAGDLHRYGLEQPQLTIAIDFVKEGALRRNILIGERAQGGRFATLGASESVFVFADETVSALMAPLVGE